MKELKNILEKKYKIGAKKSKYPNLYRISTQYKNHYKIAHKPFEYMGKMKESIGITIANSFENSMHSPSNKFVRTSYNQLAKEITNQFMFISNLEKIVFEPFTGKGEPYANSIEMLEDIHNYHLYFFKTESGFGETEYKHENVMLNKTGIKIGNYELVINDLFRIVHDIFGHAMSGYSFGPIGEDLAWFTHINMLSPLASAAMTMETRGQNCWVNYGPHMRDANGKIYKKGDKLWREPIDRPFAEQKMNLLPSSISGVKLYEDKGRIKAKYLDFWDPLESLLYISLLN